jgi:hypothetical protein
MQTVNHIDRRRLLYIVAALGSLILSVASTRYASHFLTTTSANLSVSPPVLDLGTMLHREERVGTFTLKNTSGKHIQLGAVIHTCACSGARLSKTSLLPGEEAQIIATLRSGEARDTLAAQLHLCYSFAGDAEKHFRSLLLKGVVDPDYFLEPASVSFSTRRGRHVETVILRPNHLQHITVSSISTNQRFFSATLQATNGDQARIAVHFDASEYDPSAGRAFLKVAINSKLQPIVQVPIVVTDYYSGMLVAHGVSWYCFPYAP